MDLARAALKLGDLEEAERCSSVAISADDRKISPLAIKGAIRRRNGDEAGFRLMALLAEPRATIQEFKTLVDYYLTLHRGSPMKGMATVRPEAVLFAHAA
jgi:hypothetical protein